MIISIDAEKAFDKLHHPFMKKKHTQESGLEGAFLNIIRVINETEHHTQWVKNKSFPIKISDKTRISAFTTSIQHNFGSPGTIIRQEE